MLDKPMDNGGGESRDRSVAPGCGKQVGELSHNTDIVEKNKYFVILHV